MHDTHTERRSRTQAVARHGSSRRIRAARRRGPERKKPAAWGAHAPAARRPFVPPAAGARPPAHWLTTPNATTCGRAVFAGRGDWRGCAWSKRRFRCGLKQLLRCVWGALAQGSGRLAPLAKPLFTHAGLSSGFGRVSAWKRWRGDGRAGGRGFGLRTLGAVACAAVWG